MSATVTALVNPEVILTRSLYRSDDAFLDALTKALAAGRTVRTIGHGGLTVDHRPSAAAVEAGRTRP